MTYAIVTVTDGTNPSLEYGDYRGLVVLDPDGVCVDHAHDMDQAKQIVGEELRANPADLTLVEVAEDAFYGAYGQCWYVTT